MEPPRLTIDAVYEWGDGAPSVQKRILWIDVCVNTVWLIDINDPKAHVYAVDCAIIDSGLEEGYIREVDDPFEYLCLTDDAFSAARIAQRDANWSAMEILLDSEPEIRFDRVERGKLIQQISSRRKTDPLYLSRKYSYVLWRQYCQRGQVPNALLGDRNKAGWTTARRHEKPPNKKLGRDRDGDTPQKRRAGFVVTAEAEATLHRIGCLYYKTRNRISKKKRSWREALDVGCRRFYKKGWKLKGKERVEDMPPQSSLPTIAQLKRAFYKKENAAKVFQKRAGERASNLRHRALHGDQRDISSRPMQLVQADAQTAKIYLVHRVTRLLLGRPTIVMLRCTMTRMIVGFAVTFEYESWAAYRLAIINMVTDKVDYCARHGIEIHEGEWPARHWPNGVLSDNGAMIAKHGLPWRKALNVRLFHTGSGRPEMKAVIENGFADLNRELVFNLPGAILTEASDPDSDPITRKYKESASLDPEEFEQAVIYYCLDYNSRVVKKYRLTDAMKGGIVNPIPIDLWQWGIRHSSGKLRPGNPELARLHCLSREAAKVTPEGIHFRGRDYECKRSLAENWQEQARINGVWDVEVAFDHNDLSVIFLGRVDARRPDDPYLEPCTPKRIQGERADISLAELLQDQSAHKKLIGDLSEDRPQKAADYQAKIRQITKGACKRTAKRLNGEKQGVDNLRSRRAIGIAEEREMRAQVFGKVTDSALSNPADDEDSLDSSSEFPTAGDLDFALIEQALDRGGEA
jgi:hypothetical protein